MVGVEVEVGVVVKKNLFSQESHMPYFIVVLDPDSTDPTWGSANEAIMVLVPDDFDGEDVKEYIKANPHNVQLLNPR